MGDKLFWEKFGFKETPSGIKYPEDKGIDYHRDFPEPTLDNLFRYCVHKLGEDYYVSLVWDWYEKLYRASIDSKDGTVNPVQISREDVDPALALKKAIEEAVK